MFRLAALAVLVALSVPNGAQGQDKFKHEKRLYEPALIQTEPVEGEAAKLDNEQELREASTSFDAGLLKLKRVIINEGLRRAIALHETNEAPGASYASARARGMPLIEDAVRQLRTCTASCDDGKKICVKPIQPLSNTLGESSCEIDRGLCEAICIQNLLGAVASIPSGVEGLPAYGDQALEEQREDAQVAILIQDFRSAQNAIREGLVELQGVSLEEGIRLTLGKYKEYGVPSGQTQVNTGTDSLIHCSEQTIFQTADCIDKSAEQSVDEEVTICKPNGECVTFDQVGFRRSSRIFCKITCVRDSRSREATRVRKRRDSAVRCKLTPQHNKGALRAATIASCTS